MAPRYGRAKGSERAISRVPYRRGYNITMHRLLFLASPEYLQVLLMVSG